MPPVAGRCPILAGIASLDGQFAKDPGKLAPETFEDRTC
jgi:hypothetical protein